MRNKQRKIKNRKRIVKELEIIRRRFIIVVLLIIALILISIIGKTIATEETIEPISENVSMVKSSDNIWVPVPKGYSASKIPGETSVNGGFVIYEGEDIDWSFLENTSEASTLELNSEDKNLVGKDESVKDSEQVIQETIATSAIKYTYMSNEILEKNDESKKDDITNEQIENENTINNNDNNLENNHLLENSKENENDIISKENEKETQDENQILNTEENFENIDTSETAILEETETVLTQDIFNLQYTVNQYVWIPVENVDDIYGVDEKGKLWGKLYQFEDNSPNKKPFNWTEENGKITIVDKSSSREPDISFEDNYSNGYESNHLRTILNGITQYEFLKKELEQSFYSTIESIKRYGGFYIGRYETSYSSDSGIPVVKRWGLETSNRDWYTMYKKCKNLSAENNSVTTSMIWGCLWDETLDWLVRTKAETNNGKTITYASLSDAADWGNFANIDLTYYTAYWDINLTSEKPAGLGMKLATGSTDYSKVNNIFDLAGGIWEATLEAGRLDNSIESNKIICRGGAYENYSYYSFVKNHNSWVYNTLEEPSQKVRM